MEGVVRQAGMSSTASSDRAATAAWRLFEPMQFGVSAQPKAPTAAAHDLAESIAGAMCDMTDCAEMAMFWTEVCYVPSHPLHAPCSLEQTIMHLSLVYNRHTRERVDIHCKSLAKHWKSVSNAGSATSGMTGCCAVCLTTVDCTAG